MLSDSLIVYPFNITIEGKKFDYIHAQPITKIAPNSNELHCYFMKLKGIKPTACIDGKVVDIEDGFEYDADGIKVKFIVLDETLAMQFYAINNKAIFTTGNAYLDDGKIVLEYTHEDRINIDGVDINTSDTLSDNNATLTQVECVNLPLDSYMYSRGKRKYYQLKLSEKMISNPNDYELTFDMAGSSLQVFCGTQIIDDSFNTNGNYVINIREYKKYFESEADIIIRVAPAGRIGKGKVYNEIGIVPNVTSLSLAKVTEIFTKII